MENEIVEQRKEVWLALADFYLDTQLQPFELHQIRQVFKQSGLTAEEIRRINYEEVAPVLLDNLRGVAGVWGALTSSGCLTRLQIG